MTLEAETPSPGTARTDADHAPPPVSHSRLRGLLVPLGVALLLGAALLPTEWYDTLPRRPGVPRPALKGVTLLRLAMLVDGILLLWLAARGLGFHRVPSRDRLRATTAPPSDEWLGQRAAMGALAAITALALALRLAGLGSDLWLDEISPLLLYRDMPAWQVPFTYLAPNNHLLNTLLTRMAVAAFGDVEWAIRLPAMVFGVAAVPALYWVGRQSLPRAASLGAALLLAVSYHHIFFSQNARGYTAHLLFALLACALFVKGLEEDRPVVWALYMLAVLLAVAALLSSAFVVAGHALVGAAALVVMRRRGQVVGPLARRLVIVFTITAFLAVQLYAVALPEMLVTVNAIYGQGRGGFSLASLDFVRELARGVAAGFGPGMLVAALPFLALGGIGIVSLLRRHWAQTLALLSPVIITAAFVLAKGYGLSPRLFLLALPLAMLCAVAGLHATIARVAPAIRRGGIDGSRLASASVLALAALSLFALPRYYRVPKQPYRETLRYLRATGRDGDGVVAVFLTQDGMRYYRAREGTDADPSWTFARTPEVMDSAIAARGAGRTRLVTTFHRALRRDAPELYAIVEKGWTPERIFPATVGDGAIVVWKSRTPPPTP